MNSLPPRTACLTPPAIGGIALIQAVGDTVLEIVGKHHRKGNAPVDLSQWPADELRLCRVVDGSDTIDDAVVCVRTTEAGLPVVDLNLHGGTRIVQRVLLMLQRQGVQIVEPVDLLSTCWRLPSRLHADAMQLVLQAQTRKTAAWFARLPDLLGEPLERTRSALQQHQFADALARLDKMLADAARIAYLVKGVRVVLIGPPNSGKSTLANALAEQEQAIISDMPGTTRDWTEHPAAIDGVPFTIVDTAGIRDTNDPIEAEAIRRARLQISSADLIIRVNDLSQPSDKHDEESLVASALREGEHTTIFNVYNKVDLCPRSEQDDLAPTADGLRVSAQTGQGLERLRERLLEQVGLPRGLDWPVAPFNAEQIEFCRRAREAVAIQNRAAALDWLQNVLGRPTFDRTARVNEV